MIGKRIKEKVHQTNGASLIAPGQASVSVCLGPNIAVLYGPYSNGPDCPALGVGASIGALGAVGRL